MTPFFPPFWIGKSHRRSRKHWHGDKPWRGNSPSGLVWMIGLGVLFFTGWWWPGIMLVWGASMVVSAFARGWEWEWEADAPSEAPLPADPAPEYAQPRPSPNPEPTNLAPVIPASVAPQSAPQSAPVIALDWLPNHCPNCGGPLTSRSTRALNTTTAECAWCGSRLTKEN